jgi:hypothetical protein
MGNSGCSWIAGKCGHGFRRNPKFFIPGTFSSVYPLIHTLTDTLLASTEPTPLVSRILPVRLRLSRKAVSYAPTKASFLVRVLVDVLSQSRSQIARFEREFAELEKLAGERELPRDVLQAVLDLCRGQKGIGLSESQLRARLDRLQELHILPEHRVQSGVNSDDQEETPTQDD